MLRFALLFLVVALLAGVLGLPKVAVVSAELARITFFLFLLLFLIALILGLGTL